MVQKRTIKRNRKERGVEFFIIFLINLLIISFLIVSNWRLFVKREEIGNQLASLDQRIEDLQKKNFQLKKLFEESSKSQYLEKILREKGMYKKPGERVVVIKGLNIQKPTETKAQIKNRGLIQILIEFFKNIF